MNVRKTAGYVGSIALAATLVTGCSAIADKAGEKVVEKGVEAAGGSDVDIDTDGDGSVSIDSDEGSLKIGSGELPDGFPDEVPLPDDFKIEGSMSMGTNDRDSFTVQMSSPDADVEKTHDDLKSRIEASGFEIMSTNSMGDGENMMRSFTIKNDDWSGSVTVSGDPDQTSVNYTIMTAEEDE